jgi:tetratricopeptide (TPR) repeat protein
MDRNVLEFWADFFQNAAKSQKQIENFNKWLQQGLAGYEAFLSLMGKPYVVPDKQDTGKRPDDYSKVWNKATEDFQETLKDYMALFEMVPKSEHIELTKKYEDLKAKMKDQEETIEHLRKLLKEKGEDQSRAMDDFKGLIEKQSDEFQVLMKHMSHFFQKGKE